MTVFWDVSFRVSPSQDRLTRYNQVRSTAIIPADCLDDEATAHQQIEDNITANGEPTKPYAVYTQGWRDESNFQIIAYIDPNA